MNIVHINSKDIKGGAAIACRRHVEAMLKKGVTASMFVVSKQSNKSYVYQFPLGFRFLLVKLYRKCHGYFLKKLNVTGGFSLMKYGFPICKDARLKDADVIFIHWVNGNTLSIYGLEDILKLGKPVFWYMHDMFPITGGCHYAMECKGYESDCRNCPLIKNKKYSNIAYKQLRKKIQVWNKYDNLEFVTPSRWLSECVKRSRLALGHKFYVAPNVVDTDYFKPLNINTKSYYGLDTHKKCILFGAAILEDPNKGAKYIHECLKFLDPNLYEGLIIGQISEDFSNGVPLKLIKPGPLNDEISMLYAYNACDTFIISSIAENYPNMVLEAMACGKPCIGFNTGGIPELIKNGESGIITETKTAKSLYESIIYLFSDSARYEKMSKNARSQIVGNNSYEKILDIHYELNKLQFK